MKKLITLTLVAILVMSSVPAALAAGQYSGGSQGGSSATTQSGGTMQMGQNMQMNQAGLVENLRHREQIRTDREEIRQLRNQICQCAEDVRQQVRSQIQTRDNIDSDKMKQLREAVRTLHQARLTLINEHQGKIQEQLTFLYQARLQRNLGNANQALNNIQIEQQLRIEDLSALLKDMQNLLETI